MKNFDLKVQFNLSVIKFFQNALTTRNWLKCVKKNVVSF